MNQHITDANLTAKDVSQLTSPDAIAAFLASLDYDTGSRTRLSPEAIGLSGESASAVTGIEVLSEDPEGFLRVVFVHLRSLTAKARNDLARVLGRTNVDHLLILTSDFSVIEFVLLDKRKREARGPGGVPRIQVVPLSVSVDRKAVATKELRTLRRLTWTSRDGLEQFDKLRTVFEAAASTEEYFCNRALFADHFLVSRLREDAAWRDNPTEAFLRVKSLLADARQRWLHKGEQIVRDELFEPIFDLLGFQAQAVKSARESHLKPDYLLTAKSGSGRTAAFVYAWDRWLDGPDFNVDDETPEENPGACVVSALEENAADWIIVTNGRQWRLYSRQAHSRATNFYEVDLTEALLASGDTDPNEAFRYWWLFFRAEAFRPVGVPASAGPEPRPEGRTPTCWLDAIAQGSREYAKRLGERLKDRIFVTIFPHLAQGFLEDRRRRIASRGQPTDDELDDIYEATLTLLYRLLFLLYAESRDLLPIREGPYREASLKKIKEEIADKAGIAESEVAARINKAFSATETTLYDRLQRLCAAMDRGDPALNLPTYNGGLFASGVPSFNRAPTGSAGTDVCADRGSDGLPVGSRLNQSREHRIARFLDEHKVPDRYLALAIDRLARDPDEKTFGLVFIDYKSLEVRHLGSIYEGLLEFKLKIADEDLTTQTDKKKERYIPLGKAKPGRGRAADVVVRAGEVYLSNDKAERKASGSYYTPDPIVEYIVAQTVGPVLEEKLERLRPEFRKVRKTFDRQLANARDPRIHSPANQQRDVRAEAADKTYAEHRGLVEDLFDFGTLDPAMGSGHFLVETVDFITDRMITFLNQFPVNPVTFMLDRTRRNIQEALTEQGVAVDPDKLTEVNLLKRHVLKRCIYGVDLNPMAVELAKVSLWLDAFTIGAPLSFLDHHLRCGNSLVGATFQDLEDVMRPAAKGGAALFGIDYEPLLRAIRHVIQINKMADATAAEVKQSASEYDAARRDLSGYQIVLDLLVARHFGHPEAPDLLAYGKDLDLSSRERFLKSLADIELTEKGKKREPKPVEEPDAKKKKTKAAAEIVQQVAELAQRPDLRFFHWDIEFPEVFFGFDDPDQRRIKHKDRTAPGSAGFDAVVGNPPYVRQETIKPLKEFLKTAYSTYNAINDLYVYFQELEVRKLRTAGRMGMIVANKWMRAGYGERVRQFLQRVARPLEVVDFGHSPIFPDADTFPCILLAERRQQALGLTTDLPEAEEMDTCVLPRENWHERMDLVQFVGMRRGRIPTRLLRKDGWSLQDPRVQALLEKIRNIGRPLADAIGTNPLMGIKTGFNDAFVVDDQFAETLALRNRSARKLLRPLVRGRDAQRWCPLRSGFVLIDLPSSDNFDWPWSSQEAPEAEKTFRREQPAIYDHMLRFREQLRGRQDQGRFWWELRSCKYYDKLNGPKILIQSIAFHSLFCRGLEGCLPNNSLFFIPGENLEILALMNSPLAWFYMFHAFPHKKDEAIAMDSAVVGAFPVSSQMDRPQVLETTQAVLKATEERHHWESDTLESMSSRLGTKLDRKVMGWLASSRELFTRRIAGVSDVRMTSALGEELSGLYDRIRSRQIELLTSQLELEHRLATLIEDGYTLTPEERRLLHATRPVRDPIDVLEAKIRGADADTEPEQEGSEGD